MHIEDRLIGGLGGRAANKFYKELATSARRPTGHIIDESTGCVVADTHKCCHCGCHFVAIKEFDVLRGSCFDCGGAMNCGALGCLDHDHAMKKRSEAEATGQKF